MEVGQILHCNPVGYDLPEYACSLIISIRDEISRVYWNVNQKVWRFGTFGDTQAEASKPPKNGTGIPGIDWRPYYNWGGSPEDRDWNQRAADQPNFSFDGVEIRWYKRFGRSMNANINWQPHQWVAWFDRCIDSIRIYDERQYTITHAQAIEKGNAPRRCPRCHRFFNFPARRCGWDGTRLCGYRLTPAELKKQKRDYARLLAGRKHGLPDGYTILESVDLGRNWKCLLARNAKGALSGIVGRPVEETCIAIQRPCGCIESSFTSSEPRCRKIMPRYVDAWKGKSKDQKAAEHRHAEGPF